MHAVSQALGVIAGPTLAPPSLGLLERSDSATAAGFRAKQLPVQRPELERTPSRLAISLFLLTSPLPLLQTAKPRDQTACRQHKGQTSLSFSSVCLDCSVQNDVLPSSHPAGPSRGTGNCTLVSGASSFDLSTTDCDPSRQTSPFPCKSRDINKANTSRTRPLCIVPIPCASRALPQLPRFRTLPHHHRQQNRVGSLAKAASVSYNFIGTGSAQEAQNRLISLLRASACCRFCLLHPSNVAGLPILPSRASRWRMGSD